MSAIDARHPAVRPAQPPLLELRDLCSGYGAIRVLQGLDLTVHRGEAVGVLGTNGMGKSTMLKTLIGLLPVERGSIRLQGEELKPLPAHVRARRGLGYVPQGRGILPGLTGAENLALGWHPGTDESLQQALERVGALLPRIESMLQRPGAGLSGGEQQILALARALIARPCMLLLDEPTEGIQPSIRQEIGEFLVRLRGEQDIGILLVEQDLTLALDVVQRVLVLERGQIKHEVPTSQFKPSEFASLVGMG